jgi:hypothetical protein
MIPSDIWRAANEMIRMFGEDARLHAAIAKGLKPADLQI